MGPQLYILFNVALNFFFFFLELGPEHNMYAKDMIFQVGPTLEIDCILGSYGLQNLGCNSKKCRCHIEQNIEIFVVLLTFLVYNLYAV